MKNGYLDQLWSKAVKRKWNNCCALCYSVEGLESHHIVHRRKSWVLRWDIENGISLCWKCHNLADTLTYKDRILHMVDSDYLQDMELLYRYKDEYLLEKGISEKEFRIAKSKELRGIINAE